MNIYSIKAQRTDKTEKYTWDSWKLLEETLEKQQKHATQEKKNLVQACKVRANLISGREVYLYQDRKAAARRAFFVIPMKYLQNFLKITRETIGIEKMVP
jgi:hypothetical protein